jgi:methylthioribose-1-phosphate isomerase
VQDPYRTIQWCNDHIRLLDQTLLPVLEKYIDIYDVQSICEAIKRLSVRGAPAIGVAAAMGLALGMLNARKESDQNIKSYFDKLCLEIGSTRPTAVNLFWAIDRMKKVFNENVYLNLDELKQRLIEEATLIESEDRLLCEQIGMRGQELLED